MSNRNVVPEITSITDAEGRPILDGGATSSTTLNLSGTAGMDDVVDVIVDGQKRGVAQATDGKWDYSLENLTRGRTYGIRASAYGVPSLAWQVRVEEIQPLILEVVDTEGNSVPDGGVTASTTLVFKGSAAVNGYVEFFVGDSHWGGAYSPKGNWAFIVTDLNQDTQYAFKAVSREVSSNIWHVTVEAVKGTVWIRAIKDRDGYDIPPARYTASTTVDVIGTASPRQLVRVFPASGEEKSAMADPEGNWKVRLEDLTQQLYVVKVAESIAGHNRVFRCVDQRLPIIRLARDSTGNPIPINGTTRDRSIVLTGTGAAGEELSVKNRTDLVGNPIVDALGVWELQLRDLASDTHVFHVEGSYDSGLVRESYSFQVV